MTSHPDARSPSKRAAGDANTGGGSSGSAEGFSTAVVDSGPQPVARASGGGTKAPVAASPTADGTLAKRKVEKEDSSSPQVCSDGRDKQKQKKDKKKDTAMNIPTLGPAVAGEVAVSAGCSKKLESVDEGANGRQTLAPSRNDGLGYGAAPATTVASAATVTSHPGKRAAGDANTGGGSSGSAEGFSTAVVDSGPHVGAFSDFLSSRTSSEGVSDSGVPVVVNGSVRVSSATSTCVEKCRRTLQISGNPDPSLNVFVDASSCAGLLSKNSQNRPQPGRFASHYLNKPAPTYKTSSEALVEMPKSASAGAEATSTAQARQYQTRNSQVSLQNFKTNLLSFA